MRHRSLASSALPGSIHEPQRRARRGWRAGLGFAAVLAIGVPLLGCGAAAPSAATPVAVPGGTAPETPPPAQAADGDATTATSTAETAPAAPLDEAPSTSGGSPPPPESKSANGASRGGADALAVIDEDEKVMLAALGDAGRARSSTPTADSCRRACEALGSMEQALEQSCGHSASSAPRCQDASAKVDASKAKVGQAGCSCAAR